MVAWSEKSAAGVAAATILLLLVPALYNRFPLIFPDTDVYLKVSYGHFWTLDRSGFYGLLFKPILLPTTGLAGIWLAVIVQITIIAAVLLMVTRQVAPDVSPLTVFGVIVATSLVTSLPWHAAQLMPDAFTGVLILLAWAVSSRNSGSKGTPFLWLAATLLALMHYTHLALMAVAVGVTFLFAAMTGVPLKELSRRGIFAIAAVAAVVGAQVAANGTFLHRWTVSPTGSWFLFARLNEDGLVPLWLEDHCGRDAPKELCEIRSELPRNSQVLLWSINSPLNQHVHKKIGTPEFWHWMDILGAAARGSIKDHPLMFISVASHNAARQFVHFNALDDLCPANCSSPTIISFRPDLSRWVAGSRQLQNSMPKSSIRAVTNFAEGSALLLLLPAFAWAIRRKDHIEQSLIGTVVACITANAFIGAGLSAVNDRYQSRVAWLAPFIILLMLARWIQRDSIRPAGSHRRDLRLRGVHVRTPLR